jgi:micrococcal nuclease
MWDAIGIISMFATVIFVVLAIGSLFRKNGLFKKHLKYAGYSFLLMFVASIVTGPSEDDKPLQAVTEPKEVVQSAVKQEKEQEKKESVDTNADVENKKNNQSSEEKTDTDTTTSKKTANNQTTKNNDNTTKTEEKSNFIVATVTRVVDGDTIEVSINGREDTLRLLLVDTPETKHPSEPVQPFGPEASEFAKDILSGKEVKLELNGPERDKYQRLLVYLWIGDKMFNQMLLEKGLARVAYIYDPPYTHYDAYLAAEAKAEKADIGIWSIEGYAHIGHEHGFHDEVVATTETETNKNTQTTNTSATSNTKLKYDPNGPDRDCGDFDTHAEAQAFFEAAGGPTYDPHRLDRDKDGVVCESLP